MSAPKAAVTPPTTSEYRHSKGTVSQFLTGAVFSSLRVARRQGPLARLPDQGEPAAQPVPDPHAQPAVRLLHAREHSRELYHPRRVPADRRERAGPLAAGPAADGAGPRADRARALVPVHLLVRGAREDNCARRLRRAQLLIRWLERLRLRRRRALLPQLRAEHGQRDGAAYAARAAPAALVRPRARAAPHLQRHHGRRLPRGARRDYRLVPHVRRHAHGRAALGRRHVGRMLLPGPVQERKRDGRPAEHCDQHDRPRRRHGPHRRARLGAQPLHELPLLLGAGRRRHLRAAARDDGLRAGPGRVPGRVGRHARRLLAPAELDLPRLPEPAELGPAADGPQLRQRRHRLPHDLRDGVRGGLG